MLKRKVYLSRIKGFYDSDLVKILVGIRRCGKSVIINQIIDEIKKNKVDNSHIIYINFEYIEYEDLTDYKKLNTYVKDKIIDKKIYYLFLDEVQLVDKFEVVVNSLRASIKNLSIFITGSNSKLLSNELSSILSGRYVLFNINPLSYKEFVDYTKKDGKNEKTFWDYAKWGGLPNRCDFNNENDIKNYLLSVYDSIILRDVVQRLGIKDVSLFNLLLEYIMDTMGREFSAENIVKFLKSEKREISTETLYNYLDALCNALIIRKINRYDVHGKMVLKTLNKYYMTDLGIGSIKHNNPNFDDAYLLENIVLNELIYRGYEVYIGKTKKGEIDFYAERFNERIYVQVCASLKNEDTYEREFGAYKVIDDNYPKYVLSLDKKDYSKNGIIHKNIIDWLLENK